MTKLQSRIYKAFRTLLFAALLPLTSAQQTLADNSLPTVMSLDYCSDQYVLSLADRTQILALSSAAEDLYSYHRARAKGLPKSGSTIAEVVMANPDIAVQTYSSAARMDEIAAKAGVTLLNTSYGRDLDTMYSNLSLIAEAIGRKDQADQLIADYMSRLKDIKGASRSELSVAYVTPGGFTGGVGTFINDIIELSGFQSYASLNNYNGWLPLPLEDMIMNPPDVIITSFFDSNMRNQSRWSLSRHDHLLSMMEKIPTIHLPGALMACDGLFLIEAAEQIRSEAQALGVLHE